MPPATPRPAAPELVRLFRRLVSSIGISSLLACALLVGGAAAETPDRVVKSKPQARPARSLVPPRPRHRSSLLPQTRYTVRKQIESIEPISWLERYGEVQVRELKR